MNKDKYKLLTEHYSKKCKDTDALNKYWNEVYKVYIDEGYNVFQAGLLSNDFNKHLDLQFTRRKINPEQKVILDAGCGVGSSLRHMQGKLGSSTLHGLNISDKQVEYAQGLSENINYMVGSYDDMPYEDNTFDLVVFDQSIGYRPLIGTYTEAMRVIKEGGKIIVSDMCQIDDPDPEYSMQIKSLQDNWHYMCYSVDYHLAVADSLGLKVTYLIDNMNVLLDYSQWQNLVNDKLHEFHGNCPYAPIKVSEFHFTK